MFSLTLRPTFEAELPKAARRACGYSLGQANAMGPVHGWYRIPAILPQASSLRTIDHAIVEGNERALDAEGHS